MMSHGRIFLHQPQMCSASQYRVGKTTTKSLRDAWLEIPKQTSQKEAIGEKNKANSIRYQIKAMGEISVIAWLF